jgi:hypothetical protein
MRSVLSRLTTVVEWLSGCEVSDLDPMVLEPVVGQVRVVQRLCDGLLAGLALRASEMAEHGFGPGPEGLLTGRGEVAAVSVRAEAARARVVAALPALGAALAAGLIGADHVDVVAGVLRRAGDAEVEALRELDESLARAAVDSSADSFARRVHRAMARIRHQLGLTGSDAKQAELRMWWGRDNMGRIAGRLTAEQHERVLNALTAEMTTLARQTAAAGGHGQADDLAAKGEPSAGSGPSDGELGGGRSQPVALDERLAAEALVSRITGTTAGGGRASGGRPVIMIVVDAATAEGGPHPGGICETESGGPLAWEAFNRCACDAVIRKVMLDERGVPINAGRAYRTATDAQWAVLKALHSTCAWYGCDRPVAWCQAHHVEFWEEGGPTDVANLVPLCSQHHHHAHEGGWRLVLTSDRALEHYQPDGTLWRTNHPDRLASRGAAAEPGCPSHTDTGGMAVARDCPSHTDTGGMAVARDCPSHTDTAGRTRQAA